MPLTHSPAAHPPARLQRLFALVPVALALAACGGGDDGNTVTEPPVTPAALVLTGTAATGAAIAGQPVEAKCATGSGSSTSQADGSFTITTAIGAQLPCVLRVTAADGTVLHSLATGSGSAAKANITPVSELVLASLSAASPATVYGSFDAAAAAGFTQAKADDAVATVVTTLKTAGVDLTAAGNPLTGTLVAANGNTAGNDLDKGLDALKLKLANTAQGSDFKTGLATLAQAIARASKAATATTLSNTPSLPPELLLQPAAANCSALRSGKYRLVYNREHAGGTYDTEVLTVDATAMTVTNAAGELNQLRDIGNCRYLTPANGEMTVSQAGIAVLQISDNGRFHLGLAFPEQRHPLSALAGDWNSLQLERTSDGGPIVLTNGSWTVDATGKLTAATFCEPGVDCFSGTLAATNDFPGIVGSVHADGGFNWTNAADGWTDRVFLYKTGGGELLRVSLSDAGGHLGFWTRKVARTLPEKGVVSAFWNITQNNNYTASAFTESGNTIRSVDATASSYLRDAVLYQNGVATGATRPETFRINNPRDGYSLRVAATGVLASDGSSSDVSTFTSLGLRGTGISAVGLPGNNTLILSVGK